MNDFAESGRGVKESLQSVVVSLEQIKHRADESVEQLQAAQGQAKQPKLDVPTDGAEVPVPPGGVPPSMQPFPSPS